MTVSIVLATYNGSKYILEQLDSIKNQSLPADEVLIFDDRSQDNTVEIVKNFIKAYGLKNWKFESNCINKGYARNFMDGIAKAKGELVFLCDQDDIWFQDKLKEMTEIMEKNSQISLLASSYNPFYSQGSVSITNQVIRQMKDNRMVEKYKFTPLFFHVQRPGCVYCFRKSFFDYINQYWIEGYPHDAILWHLASVTETLYLYNKITISFRRHNANSSTKKIHTLKDRIHQLDLDCKISNQLLLAINDKNLNISSYVANIVRKNDKFIKTRKRVIENRNLFDAMILAFKYKHYYLTKRSRFGDIYLIATAKRGKNEN